MSESFLKIPLARFVAARPFSRDVYLNLALNERFVRIVAAGDDISPSLLARLMAKNVGFLHVPVTENEPADPEIFPLYLESSVDEAGPAAPAAAPPPPPAEELRTAAGEKPAARESAPEAEARFTADRPEPEPETRISGGSEPRDESVTISGAEPAPPAEATVFGGQPELNEEGGALFARLKSALIGEKVAAEAGRLHRQVAASPLKERKKHRREYVALVEAGERAATGKISAAVERKYPVAEELGAFAPLAGGAATPELLSTASERLLAALKAADDGRALLAETDKLITESERFRESPVLKKLEKKLTAPPRSESDRQVLAEEAKKTFMVNRISEEILKFSASAKEKEPERRFGAELASLERALETASAGDELPEEVERRFSAGQEAEEFVTVFSGGHEGNAQKLGEQLQAIAAKRDQAMEEITQQRKDNGLLRARSHRDLPATVSRLAAYLGYSLGYSNVHMLSDLALAAVLHFAQREEEVQLSEGRIPPFVAKVLGEKQEGDFVASDAKEILQLLTEYLDNPECDREQKDFVKRIFDQAVDKLLGSDVELDTINLAKWAKFVEKGPDLAGHGLCVKASASAIKQSRSIII